MVSGAGEYRPISPAALAELLADRIVSYSGDQPCRVALDGPDCTQPSALAESLARRLPVLGRPAVVVESRHFYRDASVRLEYGHTDADAFYERWVDVGALEREVLMRSRRGQYLPTLRDPGSNRTTRAGYVALAADAVVIVSGALLLGQGLSFDLAVHLKTTAAARERRTPVEQRWTLAAFERYEREVQPSRIADIVVAMNDPTHPAIED